MARTAAILVLAILGHALLMAGGADAAAPTHAAPRHSHVELAGPFLDCPVHDTSCFTIQTAVRSAPVSLQLDRWVSTFAEALPSNPASPGPDIVPPHHPPDVARALLQVFRI